MSTRDKILQSIRRYSIEPMPRPSLDEDWIRYANPRDQFVEALRSVGGTARGVASRDAIPAELEQLSTFTQARRRCLMVEAVGQGEVDLDLIEDPHDLEDVDFAVLPAQFAVAENAAIWVTAQSINHRAIFFIPQHLALVIDNKQIVHNMHEAYQRIEFSDRSFGCFISGPSKTADIEQSLVIGAHGPRSLTVFLVGSEN